jgi:hypothetical protein
LENRFTSRNSDHGRILERFSPTHDFNLPKYEDEAVEATEVVKVDISISPETSSTSSMAFLLIYLHRYDTTDLTS